MLYIYNIILIFLLSLYLITLLWGIDGVLEDSEHTLDDRSNTNIVHNQRPIFRKSKYIYSRKKRTLSGLSSSWHIFGEYTKEPKNILLFVVTTQLKRNSKLRDMTHTLRTILNERGFRNLTYIDQHNITDYVVIDDEEFSDFKTHLDMSVSSFK